MCVQSICHRDSCLFNHRLLENHRDVYLSYRTGILLDLEGSRQTFTAGHNLPRTALFLSERNTVPLERLLQRDRRTRGPPQQVDPADPHSVYVYARGQTEDGGSDSRAVPEDDADLDVEPGEGGGVSRETAVSAPSDDDPWNVHSPGPGSPRLSGTTG